MVYGVLRYPWRMLLLALLVVGLTGSGVRFLRFSNDIRVFFSPDNPQLRAYEALEHAYARADNVLFVLAPRDGDVFTPATLASIERLAAAAWSLPYARRVDALTNFQHTYARGDELVVESLVTQAATLSTSALERIRHIALREPLLVHRLVSPTGDVTGVNVALHLPGHDPLTELPRVATAVRQLAAQVRRDQPQLDIYLTGTVMLNSALSETGLHDLQTLIPLVLLVVVVALGLLLRTVAGIVIALLVIVLGLISTMGLVGWLGIVMSPPVVSAPVVIMTLAVAHCVHLLDACLLGLRRGQDKLAALTASLQHNLRPIFLTCSTTMLGFLSLNTSDSPPFRDFGNIVALGVAVTWGLAVFLLPTLVLLLPMRVAPGPGHEGRFMERCGAVVLRHWRQCLWGMSALTVGLGLGVWRNELNDDFVKYFDAHVPFRQATDFAMAHLTGFNFIDYSLHAGAPEAIADPEYLRIVENFAQWYRQQPKVRHVYAYTDVLKRLHQNMHGDDPAWYRLPEDRELAAQYLLVYESSLPVGLDTNDSITVDKSATLLRVSLDSITTREMLALEERALAWLRAHAPPSMQQPGSGQPLVFAHISARNIRGLLLSTVIELVLISLMLIVGLRSVTFGLLSLIPNLVPATIAYGLWGFAVGRIGMALSVVVGITLGIIVDDTIYVMSTYLRARRAQGLLPAEAIRYTFTHVGTAVWCASMILVAGFAVLIFSDFEINAGMGLLSAITIAIAGVAEIVFLPPLLLYAEHRRHGNAVLPKV